MRQNQDWIYTNKNKLVKVSRLGEPENNPIKDGSHKNTREELKNILEQIKKN